MTANADKMTKAERDELARLVRRHEKLAKADVAGVAAERMAEFEAALAAQYDPKDARWSELYEETERAAERLNREIAVKCEASRIPASFAPRVAVDWYRRGENTLASRRAELRAAARAQLSAFEKTARAAIERASVEVQTQLVAGSLRSAEAKAFLDKMPTADELMPSLTVQEVERLPAGRGGP